MPSDRNLAHLYPPFRAKVEAILADMAAYAAVHMVGYKWIMVEGFRTAKYQHELFLKKPPVTHRDGYKRRSNHQSSLAVDIAPQYGHGIDWKCKPEHWEYLGHVARSRGLEWGGDWERFRDFPHLEWPESDKAAYAAARKWQKEQGLA